MNAKPRILLADGDIERMSGLTADLNVAGFHVSPAFSGRQILSLLAEQKHEVAIWSEKLRDADGVDFIKEVRKAHPDLPIVVTAASIEMGRAVRAIGDGAYQILQKPFESPELLKLVQGILGASDLRALLAVYETSRAVFASVELDALLLVVVQIAAKLFKASDVSIMLLGDDGMLAVAAMTGGDEARRGVKLALGERVAGKVAQSREPALLVGSLEGDPRFAQVPKMRDVASSIVYPLVIGQELLGVVNVNRPPSVEPFGLADVRTAAILCSQIALAVRNAKLYRDLSAKAASLADAQSKISQAEHAMLQTTRLASVGELASGMAHELNNPLTSVIGFAKLMRKAPNLNDEQREDLDRIAKESARCSQIVRNIQQFARPSAGNKAPLDLKALAQAALELFRGNARGITLSVEAPEPAPKVNADASQLQQVIIQALNNSRDALEGRSDGAVTLKAGVEAGKAVLSVVDNGAGMSRAVAAKIFDPFFTTKPPGRGTGLGLSVAYGIVREHGGSISVDSAEGRGTTLRIELPLLPEGGAA